VIPTRESPVNEANAQLEPQAPQETEGNAAWLARVPLRAGIILLGGTSLVDFRLRFAQSELRSDLTPSYWSLCGLVADDGTIVTVPLQPGDVSDVPPTNAVRTVPIGDFDDPQGWPNIAVLSFAENDALIAEHATRLATRRSVVELPGLVLDWLAYAWATSDGTNPLAAGRGIPSAAFVHAAHSLAGVELTPGLASTAACPEAIWQAVKWWHEYYAGVAELGVAADARPIVPRGYYALRQRAAAVRLPVDAPLFAPPPPPPPARRRRSSGKRT
jgi:hypothetical protein